MIEVRADIAANVWQVPVVAGQAVDVGDVLVVLESMKMEIPVESPAAGRVVEVCVAPDDRIEEGAVLVVIENGD